MGRLGPISEEERGEEGDDDEWGRREGRDLGAGGGGLSGILPLLKRRRKPQDLIREVGALIAEQKGAEAEDQFSKRDLMRQQDSGVGSTCGFPGCDQPKEVPSIMSEEGTILAGRKGQLEFIRRAKMPGFSRCETDKAVLAEHCGEDNRRRFVEVELHRADLACKPGSSGIWAWVTPISR